MTRPTRRERLRTATVTEIKDGARRLLVTGGPEAISLRAIARDMGMTAPAIYRYFPSLEALVIELAGDLFDELRRHVEHARDTVGVDPLDQLAAMARAFRDWAIQHPAEFTLAFGSTVPGMDAFQDGCLDENHPGARFGMAFLRPMIELWRRAPFPTPPADVLDRRLAASLEPLRRAHGDVPVEVAYVFLTGWTMLYGLVSLEINNHLRWAVSDPQALFEAALAGFLAQLTGAVATPAGAVTR
ncbi:TetR/AcrR family transcriptional regulator [Micromonospora sp. HM5-17]|jgi:AcrR family transcriptional regulator|uniref:TetR/AcrR family transcriptional regulator n=1 Tax=Micromonospora sp. HM5-17 TaxID=2487710 RepID=UPI000F493D83|nr:TetR/AcrR family transcriptional regulator [Micromonospora sp. HM5-17]ROT32756.1 TetR/AcrR family transcriptional regulator [Micromonospora sp. HM5-17]